MTSYHADAAREAITAAENNPDMADAPVHAQAAIAHALLDVAAAIREQTAAEHERQAVVPPRGAEGT